MKRLYLLFILLFLTGCGNSYNSQSIENRDYALDISVEKAFDGEYKFKFEVADLTDYKGDSGRSLKKEKYEYTASNLNDVLKLYYKENERQLDIGHINKLQIKGDIFGYRSLFRELSEMPYIPKSVVLKYGDNEEILLRNAIKESLD